MSEPSPIVVLGASGTIGSLLCTNLIARGLPVRAVWRSRPVPIPGTESAKANVVSGEGLNEALHGAQSLFLLTGDMPEQTQAELRIVEAAVKAGVAHIVKFSTWGAETEPFLSLDFCNFFCNEHGPTLLADRPRILKKSYFKPTAMSFMMGVP